MAKQYRDMYDLFQNDRNAAEYFDELPSYVQDQINSRAHNVKTMDNLKDYAENLTRGDG